ncbi:uncharacterized protein LOC111156449 [Enhydra lutris kenyoni]|uniref:Uncharacterized protein LOC111156449 n=1 Tax=Enhydra lutris kenyoni TaxID=391180 RepID=A0A2Y9KHM5_ENHLU|nr:uncharacterized protein LOC111156449 [Enhydra lutris kenyoni]
MTLARWFLPLIQPSQQGTSHLHRQPQSSSQGKGDAEWQLLSLSQQGVRGSVCPGSGQGKRRCARLRSRCCGEQEHSCLPRRQAGAARPLPEARSEHRRLKACPAWCLRKPSDREAATARQRQPRPGQGQKLLGAAAAARSRGPQWGGKTPPAAARGPGPARRLCPHGGSHCSSTAARAGLQGDGGGESEQQQSYGRKGSDSLLTPNL